MEFLANIWSILSNLVAQRQDDLPDATNSYRLDIIIVGGGMGGLSASIQCALSGHHVTVIEAAKELAETGAGIQVTPNAAKLLKRWGLSESFWSSATRPSSMNFRRYSDGTILFREQNYGLGLKRKYGSETLNISRVDVQKGLYDRAKDLGVEFHFGTKVVEIDVDSGRVKSAAGLEFKGDLVIGADGIWSRCREVLLGKQDHPEATGDLVYRIIINAEDVPAGELRDKITNPELNIWFGPDCHAVSYSIRSGTALGLGLVRPDDLPPGVSKKEGSAEEMRELFRNWDPILARFLDHVKVVETWKLMHRQEVETWINDKGNFVLIGDASHPMIPYLAQGANSAIEDGATIGLILGKITSKSQLPQALQMFQTMRKARGEAVARESLKMRTFYHMRDGPEQQERDSLLEKYSDSKRTIEEKFPLSW
ncbi:hypothetical protein V500_00730 [Pseudogymnoascus sp. VKM F-4518 (FW-2643)]|nr:hypothetical protein V500_00730 [Pseudogymnoascus sp. VKM F-4518 (FW-2643)]